MGNMKNELNMEEKTEQVEDSASVVTLERVLEELAYVAFGQIADVQSFSSRGVVLKDSKDLPDSTLAAISEIKFSESISPEGAESTTKSVKMHNKTQALNLLAKYFGVDSDFNQARAVLKRYGLALVPSEGEESGWQLEKHAP